MRPWRLAFGTLLIIQPLPGYARGLGSKLLLSRANDGTTQPINNPSTAPTISVPSSTGFSSSSISVSESIPATSAPAVSSRAATVPVASSTGQLTAVNGAATSPTADIGHRSGPNDLPLAPRLTAGIAVAGIFLLVTGAVYALIGIKNRWLYIPLSAAFLGSLSVIVLIIYVMSVPVRDGIQGAFVVAAIVAGFSFGGLSMVFPEITEGLGCLLGGFCLAMWLLMLKPGGLLSSSAGRGIFIAAFCVALYALSFSHHTRPYGLIGCTSFAGGTAVVLGIDCFSRAGLKEFWLYLWALNKDIFPLGTTTYPHTRGIRVELAGIIFICLLGVVSQMRLWKIVRDRRRRKAVEHEERNRDMDAAEAEAGRRIEDVNMQERLAWEAQYGDRQSTERNKGDASSEKESGSTRRYPTDTAEPRDSPEERIDTHPIDLQPESKILENGNIGRYSGGPSGHGFDPNRPESSYGRGSLKEVVPSPVSNVPTVTPLPFPIPPAEASDENEGRSSVSARAESTPDMRERTSAEADRSPGSRGDSDSTSYIEVASPSEEASLEPESGDIIDGVTSSLAATVDGRPSSNLTGHDHHPMELEGSTTSKLHGETKAAWDANLGMRSLPKDHATNPYPNHFDHATRTSETRETLPTGKPDNASTSSLADAGHGDVLKPAEQGVAPKSNPGLDGVEVDRTSSIPERLPDRGLPAGDINGGGQEKSCVPSTAEVDSSDLVPSDQPPSRASLKDQLPRKLSKLLLRYRTNEWAKHLSGAELPHVDQLDPTEDGVVVSVMDPRDGFANQHDSTETQSLHPKAHQPTPTVPGSPLADGGDITPLRSTASFSRVSEAVMEQGGRPSHLGSVKALQANVNLSRSASMASLEGGASIASTSASVRSVPPSQATSMRGLRSSSNPMPYQGLTSPSNFRPGGSRALSQASVSAVPASNTLMSQRESMVQNRFGSRTSVQLAPVLELEKAGSPDESLSASGVGRSMIGDGSAPRPQVDSIPRRSSPQGQQWIAQHQECQPPLFKRHSDLEPRRREAMMVQWRQSLRDHSIHGQDPRWAPPTARGEEMHMDRQQRLSETRQGAALNTAMVGSVDERMRQSDMLELHRLAMRKMQAVANVQTNI